MGSIEISENPSWASEYDVGGHYDKKGRPVAENLGLLPPFHLDPVESPGVFHVPNLTKESAETVSELLQQNHTSYHIFLLPESSKGSHLHNHIVHHDLTLWALGATPEQLRGHHHRNTLYQQKPFKEADPGTVKDMTRAFSFRKHLGNEWYYQDYVHFFENEIATLGYANVLQKYLVGGTDLANDIFYRMWMGYVHSIMHVGLGLEFKQMKILAEGFAQACVHHDYWYTEFLSKAEKDAATTALSRMELSECADAARADPIIRNSSNIEFQRQFEGEGKTRKFVMRREMIKDGVCGNAFTELGRVACRYRVDPNDLERETAALMNAAVYLTACCQYPPHECRPDFFLMHGSNASIWHSAFLKEPSLTNMQKARLLEQTGRVALMLYAGMGCPKPDMDWVLTQKPAEKLDDWPKVFERACNHADDGHMSKLIRTFAQCQVISKPYEDNPEFLMKQHMFLPSANAAIDVGPSANGGVPMEGVLHFDFVRGAAWPEAWEGVPIREEGRPSEPVSVATR